MLEIKGDLWGFHKKGEWIVIPTNSMLDGKGNNVMGGGLALDCARKFPNIPKEVGHLIRIYGAHVEPFNKEHILTFPTKIDWREYSDLDLIRQSVSDLKFVVLCSEDGEVDAKSHRINAVGDRLENYPIKRVYLPRVGCGLGNLDWKDVRPILSDRLDDRFIVVSK